MKQIYITTLFQIKIQIHYPTIVNSIELKLKMTTKVMYPNTYSSTHFDTFLKNVETQVQNIKVNDIKKEIKEKFGIIMNVFLTDEFIKKYPLYYDTMCQTYSIVYGFSNIIHKNNYIQYMSLQTSIRTIFKMKNYERKLNSFMEWNRKYIELSLHYSGFNVYLTNVPDKDLDIESLKQTLYPYIPFVCMVQISPYTFIGYVKNETKMKTMCDYMNTVLQTMNTNESNPFQNKYLKQEKHSSLPMFSISYIPQKMNVLYEKYDWNTKNKYMCYRNPNFNGTIDM